MERLFVQRVLGVVGILVLMTNLSPKFFSHMQGGLPSSVFHCFASFPVALPQLVSHLCCLSPSSLEILYVPDL